MTENNESAQAPREEQPALGIAGRIARQFINSPVTPLLMLAFLAVGLLGLFFTPRQEDPKISVPMVDIFVSYPGASAEQVTSLVSEPLERLMSEIPGVRHVYSATRHGESMVTVRFRVGEDMGASIVKVHDKLQSNLDKIPPGVAMPLVKPVSIDDVPIVTVTLWSDSDKDGVDDRTLRTLAFDVLQRLQEVPNTGKGFIVGGRKDRIRVEVSPERLSGFGISLDQVANTIRTANAEEKAGYIEGGNNSFSVYSGLFLKTADEISRLVIGTHKGAPVYVRDIARVYHYPEETKRMASFSSGSAYPDGIGAANMEPAVTIAVAKKIDTNGVTVANAILAKLESLKGHLIPSQVHVAVTRNYGNTANEKVNELLTALFEAAVAVSILCLIGLGVRAASVVIVIIPIVILVTIFSAWVLDYTIDRVSLFALVFAIGILVDDATVVVENIFRRWLEAGKTTLNIAIDAVREVGNPTILATLTIISALLPMGFVSGLMGPYMRPIPVLGSSAMFFSLIAAFVFAPWLAMRLRPQLKSLQKAESRENKVREFVGGFYRPAMEPLCCSRRNGMVFLILLIVLTLFACSMFYTRMVPVKMLPFDNKPEFNVVINMPEGTALPVTANVTADFSEVLREIPEVVSVQNYVGAASPFNFNGMVRHYYLRQEPWEADVQVLLLDKNKRERGSHEIAVDARHKLNEFIASRPDIERTGVRIQVVEMPPGPPVLQTMVAEIYGPDTQTRRQVAQDMTQMFREVENIVDVDNYLAAPHDYWRFEVDIEKAVRYGVSVDTINRNLDMAMGGYKLGDIKRQVVREPTYIVLQVPLALRSEIRRLRTLPIMTPDGYTIPLGELGRFVMTKEEPIIYHKDLRAIEYVVGEMEGRLGAPLYGMLAVEDKLKDYRTPDGEQISAMTLGGSIGRYGPPPDDAVSGFEWTGEWTVTYETFRDMGLAFMAALILIYGLIVWEFKNFVLAGLIMAPIPLTLIGIVPGHWLLGAEFTATSMIGFIALAGIIVRNSILLVEFVKHEVGKGNDIVDAVINAGQIRMRPILITAFTLIAGAYMIISDPIFEGMAVSLVFGTLVATILTLVVIPLGCISVRKQFYILLAAERGETIEDEEGITPEPPEELRRREQEEDKRPLWLVIWSTLIGTVMWAFYILRAVLFMVKMAVMNLLNRFRHQDGEGGTPDDDGPSPPPAGGNGGGGPSQGGSGAAAERASGGKKRATRKKTTRKKTARKKAQQSSSVEPTEQPQVSPAGEAEPAEPRAKTARKKGAKKRRGIRLKTKS
jgi:multidrug efflux pump subunit AcrB